MNRLKNLFGHVGFHFLLFILAAVLFSQPFAGTAKSREAQAMFGYLLAVWGVVIVFLFLISLGTGSAKTQDNGKTGEEDEHV